MISNSCTPGVIASGATLQTTSGFGRYTDLQGLASLSMPGPSNDCLAGTSLNDREHAI